MHPNAEPTPRSPDSKPHILVHRAQAAGAAENSLAGLRACAERGFAWAEVDVRRSGDGVHVLMHDETIDRTTTGAGAVSQLSLADLRSRSLRSAAARRNEEPVPSLSEALAFAAGRIGLYLDCRAVDAEQLAGELAALETHPGLIVCLESRVAAAWRRVNRTVRLAVYCDAWTPAADRRIKMLAPAVVEIPGSRIDAGFMKSAASAGAGVICLALGDSDTPETWSRAIEHGAGWIMTDRADEVSAYLARRYT